MTFPRLRTVTRSLICQHNGEFMRNEGDDGKIILRHGFDGRQKFLRFRGRQRRSRLVQDEDFGAAIECFQDLYDLLFPF